MEPGSDTGDSPVTPEDSTLYLQGEADGNWEGFAYTNRYLIRRSLLPSDGQILEELFDMDSGEAHTAELTVDADAETFTMILTSENGSWNGSGTLEGTPWEWTHWESTLDFDDGITIVSIDDLSESQLTAEKTGTDSDGEVMYTSSEVFDVIDVDSWEAAFAELP